MTCHEPVIEELRIDAEQVESVTEEFTDSFLVHGIHFGEGVPEAGGEHWNFSRSVGGEDDASVCTVKEIQQVVVYGGITRFELSRNLLICEFDSPTARVTGVRRLHISFRLDETSWNGVRETARRVFEAHGGFTVLD